VPPHTRCSQVADQKDLARCVAAKVVAAPAPAPAPALTSAWAEALFAAPGPALGSASLG
jgi:hypothetical protein